MFRRLACVAAVVATAACAARRPIEVRPGVRPGARHAAHVDSFETSIGKTIAAQANASSAGSAAVEATDPVLAGALLAARALGTAESHRAVAAAYAKHGILDKAQEHFAIAVKIDPADAIAWDGMARIWRDWGTPHLGLADAIRARYFAPASPVVHNTLGTILDALGRHGEARAQYDAALRLDPSAAYALNNICYSWFLQGQARRAIDACERAVQLQPGFAAAQNNLGLAHAEDDDVPAAERAFAASTEPGRAAFNLGVVHMARRRYADAVKAFEEAQRLRPGFDTAWLMARAAQRKVHETSAP